MYMYSNAPFYGAILFKNVHILKIYETVSFNVIDHPLVIVHLIICILMHLFRHVFKAWNFIGWWRKISDYKIYDLR